MKQLILTLIVSAGMVSFASAQTAGRSTSTTTPAVSGTGSTTVTKDGKSTRLKYTKLNPRRNYKWSNGQKATPTGEQAISVNGGYASLKKDTARVISPKPATKQDDQQKQ